MADTLLVQHPEIVVSATRTPRNQVDVPGSVSVINRDDLRARGTRTFAEALQDVVGLDTGEGSDNGSRLPNVGLWGLKEFDALLFTLNGVPVGGPFNPSLSQIPIEDIDRIEVVKGPQGTMYGVSAFAGMVQVFTAGAQTGGELSAGGGSFSSGHGHVSWGQTLRDRYDLRLSGAFARSDGWQDRTGSDLGRGSATLGFGLGRGRMTLDLMGYRDRQDWGSPLPFDAGLLVPGFVIDRNYAVRDAEVRHQVFGGTSRFTRPIGETRRLENTLSFTHDEQRFVRSFPGTVTGDTLASTGLSLAPEENSLFEDLRMITRFEGSGSHELVTGAALTFGETKGKGSEFTFKQALSAYPEVPTFAQVTVLDDHDFEDRRVFFGAYVHDAWTPTARLRIEGGGRFDLTSEELETEVDTSGVPLKVKDNQESSDVSGDLSAVVSLLPPAGRGALQTANLYGSVRRAFKPAAPNLAEAEAAEILEPEHTTSWEVGLKTRTSRDLGVDLAYFDMTFENLVVSILGTGGGPELVNAGKERFRGFESHLRWSPPALHGATFEIGYAHHNARFVEFTFVTPDSQLRNVSGKKLELVPSELVNGRVSVRTSLGVGGFVAARYQGERPFNRRNTFFADAFTEWDAGLSYDRDRWHANVAGRNLGDDRHVVTESEIGDAQFYVAPPRRFTAELGIRF
ncbi:MAG TPA: TonB-dependent receptor [Candidatus Eisenbacteria bacterium]|nr:TonB-dependent receptor [Candidatus Eisenbacteria bacterium]